MPANNRWDFNSGFKGLIAASSWLINLKMGTLREDHFILVIISR